MDFSPFYWISHQPDLKKKPKDAVPNMKKKSESPCYETANKSVLNLTARSTHISPAYFQMIYFLS